MSNKNDQAQKSVNSKQNGLGPVAREKYEAILHALVKKCIEAQEAKINVRRTDALKLYLERNKLASKLETYRSLLEELLDFFGEPDWHYGVWFRDDSALCRVPKVEKGIDAIQREMAELKPVFRELERMRQFESRVAEKVWLAGAPEEIAALLDEIGEPINAADSGES